MAAYAACPGALFRPCRKKFTRDLCLADSDGDGQTNGVELGDPCCVWAKNGPAPFQGTSVTHPGDNSKFDGTKCLPTACCNDEFKCVRHLLLLLLTTHGVAAAAAQPDGPGISTSTATLVKLHAANAVCLDGSPLLIPRQQPPPAL